jgi:hypothetical protein
MNPIKSLYIPHVEKQFNAEYITDIFSKNGLAQVRMVHIEPYKNDMNRLNVYNRVYISIDFWHETEAAYSFIQRLRNHNTEARIVHSSDNWWVVYINKYPDVFNREKTIILRNIVAKFKEMKAKEERKEEEKEEKEEGEVVEEYVNTEKTNILRNIVAKFKEMKEQEKEQEKRVNIEKTNILRNIIAKCKEENTEKTNKKEEEEEIALSYEKDWVKYNCRSTEWDYAYW